ncbi:hypothetical protein JOF47_001719 [Paeniglutamicibacter kerguelensis]|uniref:Uncharacterized protein n=1 Tax=Paeniglutamicibacter kerguelensis TaxID=254788 RepID=A0ABS4XCT7_9MICC|nr:hypothetical protein [Paeniglutamicibacter kerguelensis]
MPLFLGKLAATNPGQFILRGHRFQKSCQLVWNLRGIQVRQDPHGLGVTSSWKSAKYLGISHPPLNAVWVRLQIESDPYCVVGVCRSKLAVTAHGGHSRKQSISRTGRIENPAVLLLTTIGSGTNFENGDSVPLRPDLVATGTCCRYCSRTRTRWWRSRPITCCRIQVDYGDRPRCYGTSTGSTARPGSTVDVMSVPAGCVGPGVSPLHWVNGRVR